MNCSNSAPTDMSSLTVSVVGGAVKRGVWSLLSNTSILTVVIAENVPK